MSYNQSAAFLSDLIYDRSRVNPTTVGSTYIDVQGNAWQLQNFLDGQNSDGTPNGYQGAIFTNTATGQVVMTNRGTEPSTSDLGNNIQMGLGQVPSQFQSAQQLYATAAGLAASTNAPLLVTGHSLGGSLSQLIGAKYGVEATTFNAYGVGNLLSGLGIPTGSFNNITNSVMRFDPVSVLPGSNMIGQTT